MAEGEKLRTEIGDVSMRIDGEDVAAGNDGWLDVIDPSTGLRVGRIPRGTERDVDAAVRSSAQLAQEPAWRRMRPSQRAVLLRAAAGLIREQLDELAELEALDVGKPLGQARGDIESGARFFEYCAGAVDKLHGYTIPVEAGALDFTVREPWGVTAHIVPWNFPFHLATRGIAPALAMGNTVVLKPAEDASLTCLRLARLVHEAGFPAAALNVVTGLGPEVGAALARHPLIDHLTFTGSIATGAEVTRLTSPNIIPLHLELGGKSPQIVLDDADLEKAVPTIVKGFVVNAGQTCSAGTRLLVHDDVHDEVIERLLESVARLRLGAPQEDPDVGPLISEAQRARVLGYIDQGRREGLTLRAGGHVPADVGSQGFFVEPTVFDHTPVTSVLFQEEVFGPVLCVSTFSDDDQAIQLANATKYGLLAAVWTRDLGRALRFAHELQAGQVYVNGYGVAESTGLPFGGMKSSGYGRDKGLEGLLAYSQLKNVGIIYG